MFSSTKPKFFMLIGLPGSGKSTWRASVPNISDYVIVSSDDYIDKVAQAEGKTYSEVFDKSVKQASKEMQIAFSTAVAEKKDIIWDQTNLSSKKRKGILSQLPRDYECYGIVFKVEPEILKARLKKRAVETGKHIPEFVVINMLKTYEEPSKLEGFDKIVFV